MKWYQVFSAGLSIVAPGCTGGWLLCLFTLVVATVATLIAQAQTVMLPALPQVAAKDHVGLS